MKQLTIVLSGYALINKYSTFVQYMNTQIHPNLNQKVFPLVFTLNPIDMGRRHSPLPVYFQNQYMYAYFLRIIIWNTAWEREECWLAEVCPDVRTLLPCWINRNTSSALSMCSSLSPTTFTCPLWSSNTRSLIFLLSKSKTCWESRNDICFIFSLFPFFWKQFCISCPKHL